MSTTANAEFGFSRDAAPELIKAIVVVLRITFQLNKLNIVAAIDGINGRHESQTN